MRCPGNWLLYLAFCLRPSLRERETFEIGNREATYSYTGLHIWNLFPLANFQSPYIILCAHCILAICKNLFPHLLLFWSCSSLKGHDNELISRIVAILYIAVMRKSLRRFLKPFDFVLRSRKIFKFENLLPAINACGESTK